MKRVLNIQPGDWIVSDKGLTVYRWEDNRLGSFFIGLNELTELYKQLPLIEIAQIIKDHPF